MRFAIRSLYRGQDVNTNGEWVLGTFFNRYPFNPPPSTRVKHFSSTCRNQRPSATPQRNVNVFLPHEQLQVNAQLKANSETSLVADHYDLDSYLKHMTARQAIAKDAEKRRKLTASAVFLGTRYEYLIQRHLQNNLGFDLTRVGGTGDGGIDLLGHWSLPAAGGDAPSRPMPSFRVLIQAKRLTNGRKPMPSLMRELEGTLISSSTSRSLQEAFAAHRIRHGMMPSVRLDVAQNDAAQGHIRPTNDIKSEIMDLPMLGLLVTTKALTPGIEKAMSSSRRPLMYVMLEDSSCLSGSLSRVSSAGSEEGSDSSSPGFSEGRLLGLDHSSRIVPTTVIRQMAWNAAASRAGLEGFDVVTKYQSKGRISTDEESAEPLLGEAVLAYQGRPVGFTAQAT